MVNSAEASDNVVYSQRERGKEENEKKKQPKRMRNKNIGNSLDAIAKWTAKM